MSSCITRRLLPAWLGILAIALAACGGSTTQPIVHYDALDHSGDPADAGDGTVAGDSTIDTGRDGVTPGDSTEPKDTITPPTDPGPDPVTTADNGPDVPQCTGSGDCALGNICIDSRCVPGCTGDRDCQTGLHCDAASLPHGFCAECLKDEHCDSASGEKCLAGICVMTCRNNDDCTALASTPLCDTSSGTCVQCLSDGTCPQGTLCLGFQCVSGCRSDRDCPDDLRCDPKAGANGGCFACVQDADCQGRVCRDHQCVIDCSAVNCPPQTPVCNPSTGGCVRCLGKSDCPAGNLCLNQACVAGCETDDDCSGGRKCASGTCVQCVRDDQCGAQQKCLQNQCLSAECSRDTDCGGGRYCHPLLLSCEDLPAGYCVTNSNCSAGIPPIIPGEMCDPLTRTCIPSCSDALGFPICFDLTGQSQRTVCVDGGCYYCGSDGDCAGTLCDPFDRQCRVCKSDGDCSIPTWHCDTGAGTCKECLNDGQCASPKVCDEAGGYTCVECLQDKDCKSPSKPVCGKSKVCIPACSNECTGSSTACNPGDTVEPIGFLTCGDYDDDPCLEFGSPAECGTGASCRTQAGGLGKCICQNECSNGQKRCTTDGVDDTYQTCAQASGSGCWYWSTGYCGNGEVCSAGSCVCGNICVLGAKACDKSDNTVTLICDDYDYYDPYANCPYWQYGNYCNTGYVCKGAGVCSLP